MRWEGVQTTPILELAVRFTIPPPTNPGEEPGLHSDGPGGQSCPEAYCVSGYGEVTSSEATETQKLPADFSEVCCSFVVMAGWWGSSGHQCGQTEQKWEEIQLPSWI